MERTGSVTAVLLNWRRPDNMVRIVERVLLEVEIQRVVVWDNSGTFEMRRRLGREFDESEVRVIVSPENVFTLGRFEALEQVDTEYVYTQDDDVMVGNIRRVIRACRDEGKIATYMDEGHIRHGAINWVHEAGDETLYESFLGWGSCFKREWAERALESWTDSYGEGHEVLARKADRIFCMLASRFLGPHVEIECDIDHMTGYGDHETALYRRSDHWELSAEAARMCVEMVRPAHEEGAAE